MRRGNQPDKPRAWLLTIARNVVRRRAQLRAERPQEVELDDDSNLLVSLDEVEGSASADINAAFRHLTDAQREAILLREIQGRSYAEIAFELGLSVAAVEALIFRARRALAEELELVDRVPVVRPEKRHGLFAFPGLAKLGSFWFSFGRASVACLVGCAVVATVPVKDGSARQEPRAAAKPPMHHVVVSQAMATRERPHPVAAVNDKERSEKGKPAAQSKPGRDDSGESSGSFGGSLLPVEVSPVELPPAALPPVEVTVPSAHLPPPPELPSVPPLPLPSVTS